MMHNYLTLCILIVLLGTVQASKNIEKIEIEFVIGQHIKISDYFDSMDRNMENIPMTIGDIYVILNVEKYSMDTKRERDGKRVRIFKADYNKIKVVYQVSKITYEDDYKKHNDMEYEFEVKEDNFRRVDFNRYTMAPMSLYQKKVWHLRHVITILEKDFRQHIIRLILSYAYETIEPVTIFTRPIRKEIFELMHKTVRYPHLPHHIITLIFTYLEDAATKSRFCRLSPHTGGVRRVMASQDGSVLLSLEYSGPSLQLSDTKTGYLMQIFHPPRPRIVLYSAAIASNHSFVVAGGNPDMYLWHTGSGNLETILTGHTQPVTYCCIFRKNTRLASASDDTTVRVWEITRGRMKTTYRCLYVLRGHTNWIDTCMVSADERFIFSGSRDGTLWVWEHDTWTPNVEKPSFFGFFQFLFYGLKIMPSELKGESYVNSNVLSDSGYVGTMKKGQKNVLDLNTSKFSVYFNNHRSCHTLPVSTEQVVWWTDHEVGVWNKAACKNEYTKPFPFDVIIQTVTVYKFHGCQYLMVVLSGWEPKIYVYNFETGLFFTDYENE